MSVIIEQDLKDYLQQQFESFEQKFKTFEERFDKIDERFDKIDKRFDKVDHKMENLQQDVVDIKISIAKLDGQVNGEIRTLGEKVDGLAKRIDNQEFVSRGVLIGLIVAIAGSAAKLFGLVGNP